MQRKIGVFDSGSGGLTVLDACAKALPEQSFVYLGDHFRAPYGSLNNLEIVNNTDAMVKSLFNMGIGLVILACNTASAVALRTIQEGWLPTHFPGRRVLGVLVPTVEALTGLTWDRDNPGKSALPQKSVAVFATERTVKSGAYPHQVKLRAPAFEVTQQACPGLVAAIENDADEASLKDMVTGYCNQLLDQMDGREPDAALLGCAHYPLVEDYFRDALPDGTEVLSQPEIVANALKGYLERHPDFAGGGKQTLEFYTTGSPESLHHLDKFIPGRKIRFKPH